MAIAKNPGSSSRGVFHGMIKSIFGKIHNVSAEGLIHNTTYTKILTSRKLLRCDVFDRGYYHKQPRSQPIEVAVLITKKERKGCFCLPIRITFHWVYSEALHQNISEVHFITRSIDVEDFVLHESRS